MALNNVQPPYAPNFMNTIDAGWLAPWFNLPTVSGGVNIPGGLKNPNSGGTSLGQWFKNYNNKWGSSNYGLLNAGISAGADLAGNLINSNGLSSTAGNIMSGVGNIVGNIPGPIGWAGKGVALLGSAVNALWGHKFNDANIAAAENANAQRNNWQFGDYSNTDALLAGSAANVLLGNVSKSFIGKEGPFSNAVTNKTRLINNDRMLANLRANNSELNAYNNYLTGMVRSAIAGDAMGNVNAAAAGGPLNMLGAPMTSFGNRYFSKGGLTHGGLFNNGFIEINNGGSHELNPYQGVQYGVDPQGTPNMVEEGETILDDYVFSKRIKFPKKYKDEFSLGGKLWKKSFADISKIIAKESDERPNDPISQKTLKAMGGRLADIQEEVKAKQALDKMDPREVIAMLLLLAMMLLGGMEQQPMMEDPYALALAVGEQPVLSSNGGSIHIKPSKRGTFTAAATKHGKSVQEFASQVLANPDNYSPAMVKKANFARNAANWNACGGKLHSNGGNLNLFAPGGYLDKLDARDLAYINRYNPMDLTLTLDGKLYLISPRPYDYAVGADNKNVTPNYKPVNNKRSWVDFVDYEDNPLYDVKTQKYTDAYLDKNFLTWAYDNPDTAYLLNKANFVNWIKDNPDKLYPTQDEIFGGRGLATGKGFDKKLSDLHWYLLHMYNRYRKGIADGSIKVGEPPTDVDDTERTAEVEPVGDGSNTINEDPKKLKSARTGYTENGIRYFIDEVDANGTPTRREIEYDPDTFADLYPGYRYSKEDEKLYDDENKTFTRQFIYTKGTEPLKYHELPTYGRHLTPAILGIYALLGLAKLINQPDNQFAKALAHLASTENGYIPARYNPIPNPFAWNPLNVNSYMSNLDNSKSELLRYALNAFGNNAGVLTAANANIINTANKARGEGLKALLETDLNRRKEYGLLSTDIFKSNSLGSLDAQKANQTAFSNWLRQNRDTMGKAIEYGYRAKQDSDEANSNNMSGWLDSMSDIFNENMNWNWRNWAIANGVFGPMKTVPYGYGIDRV